MQSLLISINRVQESGLSHHFKRASPLSILDESNLVLSKVSSNCNVDLKINNCLLAIVLVIPNTNLCITHVFMYEATLTSTNLGPQGHPILLSREAYVSVLLVMCPKENKDRKGKEGKET